MVNLKEFKVDKLILLISIMRKYKTKPAGIALKNKLDEILQKTSTPNCNHFIKDCNDVFTDTPEEFVKYIKNSEFVENLQPIFETKEFNTLYEETLEYKKELINRWNETQPRVNKYFSEVLGLKEDKDIVVNIVNPNFNTGTNNMKNEIYWGHYKGNDNPNYDAVYLMHESMHCMFPYKKEWNEKQIGICHSLIELAIDNELMRVLNEDNEYKYYNDAHNDGKHIRKQLKPTWDKFLQGKTDNKNFAELMQYCTENYKLFDNKKFLANNKITKIFVYLKNFISRTRNKSKAPMLLPPPKEQYIDIIKRPEIANIIENMPKNLSNMEKAYYVYRELGQIVSESPKFVFTDRAGKERHYNDKIDEKYYGICKSIAELYVSILKDKRIGISADLVKESPNSPLTHIDTILKIDGKNYIANLISDLWRIKKSMRTNSFGFDLERMDMDPERMKHNQDYLRRLKEKYGNIDSITRAEREKLDEKLGYVPMFSKGFYTEDKIPGFKKSMEQYLAENKDIPEELRLKYKLDYVFENINKLTNNNNINYLENIKFYINIANKILEPNEKIRINSYVATVGEDWSNIISILKVKPLNKSEQNNNLYYQYSNKDRKYVGKTPEAMKEFLDGVDKEKLKIIGNFDKHNPRKREELELK